MSVEKWLERHEATDDKRFEGIDRRFDEVNAKLDEILTSQSKQKGFIAGFSAAFSLLVSTVLGLIVYIWQHR